MDIYTATEEAYKKGYEQGKKDAVVKGRWITSHDNWTVCSECKTLGSPQWKGCPVCLARMDGE